MVVTTSSPEETRLVGERVAGLLEPGDAVLLLGALGAGKTTFVQGVASGLGCPDEVTSPTFTLCQSHPGRLVLYHADLWRLERLQEVIDLALDEGLEEGGVLVVEWGEAAADLFGEDALVVHLDEGATESERLLAFEANGGGWERRLSSLS